MLASFALLGAVLANGSFEAGDTGEWKLQRNYRIVAGEGRNGSTGLKFEGAATNGFVDAVSQAPQLKPGVAYMIEAWAKSEDFVAYGAGLKLGFEWTDAAGKRRGVYSSPIKGDVDWTRLSVTTKAIAPGDSDFRVLVYAGYGDSLGRAWIDDVMVTPVVRAVVEGLYADAYRNTAAAGKLTLHAALNPPAGREPASGKCALTFTDAQGRSRELKVTRWVDSQHAVFELTVDELALGETLFRCSLGWPGEAVAGTAVCKFVRTAAPVARKVAFDRQGRTRVDGRPFFPLGMFAKDLGAKELDRYCEAPFNCVLSYRPQSREKLDELQRRGLKFIPAFNNAFAGGQWALERGIRTPADELAFIERELRRLKDHPAILAWYLNDERGIDVLDRLKAHQELCQRVDPDHPTFSCLYQLDQLRWFMGTSDAFGVDPYPVPRRSLGEAAQAAVRSVRQTLGVRAIWQVPQAFAWSWFPAGQPGDRMPTAAEMRSMTWQAIAGGANGLIYYAFHPIFDKAGKDFEEYWQRVKTVVREVKRFEPWLLSEGEVPDFSADTPELQVPIRLFAREGRVMALVVNATADARTVTIRLSRPFGSAAVSFGEGSVSLSGDSLAVRLPAWDAGWAELNP